MIIKTLSKFKALPLTVRAVFWFTVCNVIIKGISFISSFVFTRMIPQDEYGRLSIFSSYEHIILVFATWEIQQGAYTHGLFKFKDENREVFTSSMISLTNILTISFFSILLLFNDPVAIFTGMNTVIILLLGISYVFNPAYTGWMTRKRINYDYKPVVFATLLFAILNVIVPVVVLQFYPRTAEVKFSTSIIVSSIFWLLFWIKSAKYSNIVVYFDAVKKYWKFMIRYEAPLVFHSLSFFLLNQADRIMIGKMVGNRETALYSVAYSLAFVITILQTSLDQVLQPWRYHRLINKEYNDIQKVSNSLLLLYGILVLVFILVAPEIMQIFYPADYYEGIWCIPPVAAGAFFMFMYSLFVGIEMYFEQTKYILYVSLILGFVNIILNYFGILSFGYIACAYTTLICFILFAIGHYFFMKKTLRAAGTPVIYSAKNFVILGFGVISLSVVISQIYHLIIVRYCFLLVICLSGIILRKKIMSLINHFKEKNNSILSGY